jgi:hypothetical protein
MSPIKNWLLQEKFAVNKTSFFYPDSCSHIPDSELARDESSAISTDDISTDDTSIEDVVPWCRFDDVSIDDNVLWCGIDDISIDDGVLLFDDISVDDDDVL